MADPLTHLKQRSGDDWLVGYESREFFALAECVLGELRSRPHRELPLTILLAERDPLKFLAHFVAACAANCHIFLANPDWVDAEWQHVFELVKPDVLWGEAEGRRQKVKGRGQEAEGRRQEVTLLTPQAKQEPMTLGGRRLGNQSVRDLKVSPLPTPHSPLPTPHIMIPTGGTSGTIRFAIHTWATLMASVDGFCRYFEVEQVNSFCVLPLYHVSGLMQFLRSFTSGGRLVVLPFKAVEAGDRSPVNPEEFFLSLVPTQLQRLLNGAKSQESEVRSQEPEFFGAAPHPTPHSPLPTPHSSIAWLSRFHTVLLGGAPAWADLFQQARSHRIRLAPTYGMTETASQIATLKPDDFLNGYTNAGQVLPHAQITIRKPSGEVLNAHEIGTVTIQAKSLAIGFYPALPTPDSRLPTPPFQPDDLGFFDAQGYLHIVGRHSDKIITGGENVFPAEIEAAIRSTALVQDICVLGVNDRHWGQAIAAVYIPIAAKTPAVLIQAALTDKLSKYKRPKHWIAVAQLPRNAQGKVNRPHVEAIAKAWLSVATTD